MDIVRHGMHIKDNWSDKVVMWKWPNLARDDIDQIGPFWWESGDSDWFRSGSWGGYVGTQFEAKEEGVCCCGDDDDGGGDGDDEGDGDDDKCNQQPHQQTRHPNHISHHTHWPNRNPDNWSQSRTRGSKGQKIIWMKYPKHPSNHPSPLSTIPQPHPPKKDINPSSIQFFQRP